MLRRRDFLKLIGLGGAGSGLGFLLGESTKNPAANLIPYLIPPEDVTPGVADWYATLCRQCNAGCGIIVRVMEGRAKKIEGNPLHPVNRGRLCVRGQAGLQVLYNPDRIKTPLKRKGGKGSGEFQEISWEEGLSLLTEHLSTLQANQEADGLYLLTSPLRGHLHSLLENFMKAYGSPNLLVYGLFHHQNLLFANRISMGPNTLPHYDIGNTNFLISFGTDFLETWISPVNHSLGYGHLRQGRAGKRGRVVQVEPRLSLTGANADEWIPVRPGTEGLLAMGMAYVILENGYYKGIDVKQWEALLAGFHPKYVSILTDVGEDRIKRLAREFATIRPSLAIGGENISSYENGISHLMAVNILNHLSGNIGTEGGIIPNREGIVNGDIARKNIASLAGDTLSGKVKLLIIYDTNPVFTTPAAMKIDEAMNNIPYTVSLSSFMDESTLMADLILPTHTYLEDWGDDFAEPGVGYPVATMMQPVVSPLYNTRGVGDIFLSLAKTLGGEVEKAMPWGDFHSFLKDSWKIRYDEIFMSPQFSSFDVFWNQMLAKGGWWVPETPEYGAFYIPPEAVSEYTSIGQSKFEGDEAEYSFYLILYPHPGYLDGRGANLPWLQEMPDPMTSVVWGSWVEINPETARKMGIKEREKVSVESPYGSVHLPVYLYQGIRPDTVSIPIGQGHRTYGRYARGRGANPVEILPLQEEPRTGAIGLNTTRVRIVRSREPGRMVKMEGSPKELGRGIVKTITPDEFRR